MAKFGVDREDRGPAPFHKPAKATLVLFNQFLTAISSRRAMISGGLEGSALEPDGSSVR